VGRSDSKSKRHSQLGSAWGSVRKKVLDYGFQNPLDVALDLTGRSSRGKKGRLGKNELGPYANENQMPRWLMKQLQQGPRIYKYKFKGRDGNTHVEDVVENETPGIVPMLARLSELDSHVRVAYYSHPATKHIGKIRGEGGFCGYRNIQMQLSYLQGSKAQGHEAFPGPRTPGILRIQDDIENAWDNGISAISRKEIGVLKGTRKWIGTTEANAFFTNHGIACDVYLYSDNVNEGIMAHETLFNKIEAYFKAAVPVNQSTNPSERIIHRLSCPPIYLQHPGHSVTVVGLERHKNGKRYLMVLDPMYVTSRAMDSLLDSGPRNIRKRQPEILDSYRRGESEFKKYRYIESLTLSARPPSLQSWEVRT
jgi:hypothetical protein